MLYREPKLLKGFLYVFPLMYQQFVSVLYREPKLLKVDLSDNLTKAVQCFSALP